MCCTASNIGGSTHGRLRASFLTRNTHVSPDLRSPSRSSFHGQRTSKSAYPSRHPISGGASVTWSTLPAHGPPDAAPGGRGYQRGQGDRDPVGTVGGRRRPAGRAVGVALAAGGQGRGRGDRRCLLVEGGVRRPHLVEGRVHVGSVAALVGQLVEGLSALLGDVAEPGRH